jgi:hypothetical protein
MIPLFLARTGGWSLKVPLGVWAYGMLRQDSTLYVAFTSPIYVAPWLLTVGDVHRSERLRVSAEIDRPDTSCKRRGNKPDCDNILPVELREDLALGKKVLTRRKKDSAELVDHYILLTDSP